MGKRVEIDSDGDKRTYWAGIGETMLTDHMSTVSRKCRRNLIIASAIGIVTALTGLFPKKIAGVDLTGTSQSVLIWFLILAVIYQWVSFAIYSWPERMAYSGKLHKAGYKPENIGDVPVAAFPAALRTILDYYFPNALALISLVLLVWYAIPKWGSPADSNWLGYLARIVLTITCVLVLMSAGFVGFKKIRDVAKGDYAPDDPEPK